MSGEQPVGKNEKTFTQEEVNAIVLEVETRATKNIKYWLKIVII